MFYDKYIKKYNEFELGTFNIEDMLNETTLGKYGKSGVSSNGAFKCSVADNEGDGKPHLHIISKDKKIAVRIDTVEYFIHPHFPDKFNKDERDAFNKFMGLNIIDVLDKTTDTGYKQSSTYKKLKMIQDDLSDITVWQASKLLWEATPKNNRELEILVDEAPNYKKLEAVRK